MKKNIYILCCIFLFGIILFACNKEFLERPPQGSLDENTLASEKGVDAALIGAYGALDGWTDSWNAGSPWPQSVSNWIWGDVRADDAYKGSNPTDQAEIVPIEALEVLPDNPYVNSKWQALFNGISRTNATINLAEKVKELSEDKRTQVNAEARFIRAFFHFDGKKNYNKFPYVDEKVTDFKVSNAADIWPNIEEDLTFAADNLPETQADVGRINKWAAKAMLAKTYMFQKKYTEALPLLNDIIANGKTSNGKKYALTQKYHDNFNAATKNNEESVFAIQMSVNDGDGESQNGRWGDILNFPYTAGPGTCCGFDQPTQNLVNAHRVDANGLPLFDTFNQVDVKNDQGLSTTEPFTPETLPLDPRLDWSVGRRGIPYLDWGPHPGATWIRDQPYAGPFSPKKNVYYKNQEKNLSTSAGWAQMAVANNYVAIRFADVLLWAAECEIEIGDVNKAREYVNQIRRRAANPEGFVKNPDGTPAANYQIGEYTQAWGDKEFARKALRFERRLELAMEGHRFYDLVRWDIAAEVLNAYIAEESKKRQYLRGVIFNKGVDEYLPIPNQQIVLSSTNGKSSLEQNPGF